MKIGNFEVGDYAVKESGGKRHLIFDCRNCVYSSSLADDKSCRYHVINILSQVEADLIVLAEVYERVYNKGQTKLLKEIAELIPKFELENIWGVDNLGKTGSECEKFFGLRHDLLVKISHELIGFDPILSYINLLSEIRKEKEKMQNTAYAECSQEFMKTLLYLKQEFEKTDLISKAKSILVKLEEMPDTKQLYYSFFEAQVKPSFIGSRLMFEKAETLELLDEYTVKKSGVQIFKHPNKVERLYFLNPPEYTLPPEKYFVLSKTKEIVATYQPGKTSLSTIAKSRKYFERVYESTIFDIAKQNNINLSKEEVKELSEIVARYTVGYGILEILLSDRNLTDIYLDSPIGQKPLYVVHSEYGQCQTNILYTEDEAESLVSKLRAMSGRPFDEAHPILDYDLQDLETRTAVIGKPLAPDGIAFAFRLHKMTPWTLPQFIDNKFITPLGAGLLSFFVDTQSTMLVTGSRGSGKTSLVGAIMLEILQNARVIVQEDTMELPVNYMKEIGFNIQRLKTRAPIGTAKTETEVSPEDALRTALRLGDSALVIGEVRSSIRGNQEVVIVEKGITKRVPIKEVEEKCWNDILVPTLDSSLKTCLAPLTSFVKHPKREKLLEVTTKTGRKVTVTHDHSLFIQKGFKVEPIECKDLEVGEKIIIPSKLPSGFNDIKELDLTEYLDNFRIGNCREFIREAIKKVGWKKATEIVGIKTGDIYNFFRKNQKTNMKLSDFIKLMDETNTSFDKSKIVLRRTQSKGLPGVFSLSEDFCRFLGYYLAEGYIDLTERAVFISNSNKTIIDDVTNLSRNLFGVEPFIRKTFGLGECTQIRIDNSALAQLMLRIGCGRTSEDKRVPQIIFGLKKEKIAQLLKGFYSGDGSFTYSVRTGHSIRAFSKTKKLMEDVLYSLLCFGIVGRIKKQKNTVVWNVEFKRIEDIKTFFSEIGFVQKESKIIEKAWAHSNVNQVEFSEKELIENLSYPRKYRHLKRFKKCSKYYLQKVVLDEECTVSEQLKTFALGDFYLDEVVSIKEIELKEPEYVFDLSVDSTERFIGGFGGILLHNTEARVLYEAMRVGAAGNIVLGTIHGDSAYSVWDRVVNDLNVPSTSFKATDVVVVARPIRFGGSLERHRRVVQITEIKKEWISDPLHEGGLLDLMLFDASKDKLELKEDNLKESSLFDKIHKTSGLSMTAMWDSIKMNSNSKAFMVELKNKLDFPELIEAENTVPAVNKLMLMKQGQLEENGSADFDELLGKWKFWYKNDFVKRLHERRKKK